MPYNNRTEISLLANPVAASSTDVVSSAVDLSGFTGCLFIGTLGAATTGASITIQLASATSGAWHNASGATVQFNAANRVACVDLYEPQRRYARGVFASSAASDYSGLVAVAYDPIGSPTTAGSGAIATVGVSGAT